MTKIIGLNGVARSGKDTCANFIEELHQDKKILRLYFSKLLKDVSKMLFNLTDEHVYTDKKEEILSNWKLNDEEVSPRKLLQWLGTDILRKHLGQDFFIKHMKEQIQKGINENYDFILITDVRFDNEGELVKELGGIVINVHRPGLEKINLSNHVSEKGINESLIDKIIINDSTLEEFKEKVKNEIS